MGQSCILTVGFSTRNFFLFFFSFFFLFFYFQSASAASRRNKKTGDHLATMKVTIFCSALALFLAVWTEAAPVENGDMSQGTSSEIGVERELEVGRWLLQRIS